EAQVRIDPVIVAHTRVVGRTVVCALPNDQLGLTIVIEVLEGDEGTMAGVVIVTSPLSKDGSRTRRYALCGRIEKGEVVDVSSQAARYLENIERIAVGATQREGAAVELIKGKGRIVGICDVVETINRGKGIHLPLDSRGDGAVSPTVARERDVVVGPDCGLQCGRARAERE